MPSLPAMSWPRRADAPPLVPGEVHVWRLEGVTGKDRTRALEGLLDDMERRRADAFAFARHRAAFVSSHGQMREVLGRYLGVPPAVLAFVADPGGKPRLVERFQLQGPPLRFNLSHSGGIALLAVASGREVGVDVEAIRNVSSAHEIARKHLSGEEAASINGLEGEALDRAFLSAWARHEALLKAQGVGLFVGVSPSPETWEVLSLPLDPSHVAALGFERGPISLSGYTWAGSMRTDRPPTPAL